MGIAAAAKPNKTKGLRKFMEDKFQILVTRQNNVNQLRFATTMILHERTLQLVIFVPKKSNFLKKREKTFLIITYCVMSEELQPSKKIIFSGMQPTNQLMLGNYIGALRQWVGFQDSYKGIFSVVDLHALTIRPNPALLRKQTLDFIAMYIATGIDPEKSIVFVQSHVPEHSQLTWVLNCFAQMGECSKMTQYKEKSEKFSQNVGLFTYPVLMAADILLYQTDVVPVGADQKQHLELARNLAERFNGAYSPTFVVPEPFIPEEGARIMSLQEPTKKMSKSDENPRATIFLTDTADEIRSKIKRAVTDSGTTISFDESRPAISNLLTIYSVSTGRPIKEIEQEFDGVGFETFKKELGEQLVTFLKPFSERYTEIRSQKDFLNDVMATGAKNAQNIARKTLRKVYKKIGLTEIE
jgi:tryptophanyl-tRNA synthetase